MTQRATLWRQAPAEFARAECETRLVRVLAELERTTQHPDEDAVHDLRVAIRRFSQALRVFSPLISSKGARRIRRRMKTVLDAAAVVRDLDVGLEMLAGLQLDAAGPLISGMREKRKRAELYLMGQVYLLRSEDLEQDWPKRLGWTEL